MIFLIADNSHLPTIEAVLRRSKFDDTKSCHLGLSLHLPYKSIRESSHQNHPLLEFLTLWLESGRATVELLIFALKYIEEDVSADHIQKLCEFGFRHFVCYWKQSQMAIIFVW